MGLAGLYHYVGKQSPLRETLSKIEEEGKVLF